MNFGIIGFGRFGQLLAKALLSFGRVSIYDKNPHVSVKENNISYVSFEHIVTSDFLFLLVPISSFEHCCQSITPFLPLNTVVVDCCSVKVHSMKVMNQTFSKKQSRIATHPLFGPDSVKSSGGFQGHQIVLCPAYCNKEKYEQLMLIFKAMGLKIILTTAHAHDKKMAMSQSLVHFIGRGLDALNLKPLPFATPDFQSLLKLKQVVMNDQLQLFMDMHRYNPYAKAIRKKLLKQLEKLDNQINSTR